MVRLSALLLACSILNGQTPSLFDLPGVLKLVDRPPQATPVEFVSFRFHPLDGGRDIDTQPDREGKFTLRQVRPGRYSLMFPMPGRIQSFTSGASELAPEGFELASGSTGPVVLVVSMKDIDIAVNILGLPSGYKDIVALLVPADTRLTLRESCHLNPVSGPRTLFRFVPPGKYRVFIVDAGLQRDVSAYAPRFPDFLKNETPVFEASATGLTEVTASYLDGETVKAAVRSLPSAPAR